MSIQNIVEQALTEGYLTPTMETEVSKICDSTSELSLEEYMALDGLMRALLDGKIVAMPRKQFINVLEELVIAEAIAQVAYQELNGESLLDIGDIAAYALNRLPPLYATSEEGAHYQRQRAKEELQELIIQQVEEAIQRLSSRPIIDKDRVPISKRNQADLLGQMNGLLKSYATNFEARMTGKIE